MRASLECSTGDNNHALWESNYEDFECSNCSDRGCIKHGWVSTLDFECPNMASQVPGKHSAQDLLDSVALLAPSSSWGPGAPQRSSWLLTPSPDTQDANGKFVVVESWRLEISHLEFRISGGLNLSSQVSMRIYLSGKLALYGFVPPELDGSEFGKPSITIY